MSAYIVYERTINKVVSLIEIEHRSGVRRAQRRRTKGGPSFAFGCIKVTPGRTRNGSGLCEIGRTLYLMNTLAINMRYGERERPPHYPFREPSKTITTDERIAMAKSARCLLYQCSEGDVPKNALFQDLAQLVQDVGADIIEGTPYTDLTDHPSYEAALWG